MNNIEGLQFINLPVNPVNSNDERKGGNIKVDNCSGLNFMLNSTGKAKKRGKAAEQAIPKPNESKNVLK